MYHDAVFQTTGKHSVLYDNGGLLACLGRVVRVCEGELHLVALVCVFSERVRGLVLTVGESPFSTFIKGAFSIVTTTA